MMEAQNTIPNFEPTTPNSSEVMLLLFTPRQIQQQQIRSYNYKFQSGLPDWLDQFDDMSQAIASPDAMSRDVVNSSILPDNQGVTLDTSIISQQWTFILVIDLDQQVMIKRLIYAGWFKDEPMNINQTHATNPPLNRNATMVINTSVALNFSKQHSAKGQTNMTNVDAAHVIPSETNQISPHDLFYMTPGQLSRVSTTSADSDSTTLSFHDLSIANGYNDGYFQAGLNQQSPMKQLSNIVQSVDSSLDLTEANAGDDGIVSPVRGEPFGNHADPLMQFHDMAGRQMASEPTFANNLSNFPINQAHYFGELLDNFPNIQIYPVKVNPNPQWDQRPQDIVCPQNIYSYMAVQVIEAYALGFGIGDISFRYCSYSGNAIDQGGSWSIENVQMLANVNQEQIRNALQQFKVGLENDLFPILLTVAGEFDLMVRYDTSQTLISLNFLDYPDQNQGFLEFSGSIGGMTLPILGTDSSVVHNQQALDTLVHQIGGKHFKSAAESESGLFGSEVQSAFEGNQDVNNLFDGGEPVGFQQNGSFEGGLGNTESSDDLF